MKALEGLEAGGWWDWVSRRLAWPNAWCLGVFCLLAVFVLVVPADAGLEPSGSLRRSPTEIIKNYVRLDMKGARLEAKTFDALRPYIEWTEEPAWGSILVIEDVEVVDDYRQWDIINNLEVVIPVTFHVLGSVQFETALFVPEEMTEQVRFRVKAVGNFWRIVEPMIPPHVGFKRMVNFVREAQLREQDQSHRVVLKALVDSLRAAR